MRLQYADFIRKGEGLTQSPVVTNLLDANIMYLTVISESDPSVSIEAMTGDDPVNGTWLDIVAMMPDGTVDSKITVNGLYSVPIGGVRYLRVNSDSADDTLEVYGSFTNAACAMAAQTEEAAQDGEG